MSNEGKALGPANAEVDESELEESLAPFAQWIRTQRAAKGWTQRELAQKAGISTQQISNLETGRSRNPQKITRDALAQALDVQPPADAVTQEAKDTEVPGLGSLESFDPYDTKNLPSVKGVYVFYDRTKRPVYVGRATKRTIAVRVAEHFEKFWFKAPVVNAAFYLEVSDEERCKQLEQVLIKFMRTHLLLNKQGVETEIDDD